MTAVKDIKRLLGSMNPKDLTKPISCVVKSVQGNTCTVIIAGDLEVSDVRLRATATSSGDELLVIPLEGSKALMLSITGTLDDLVLIKIDKVASIAYKQGELEIGIDSSTKKVMVKNAQTSLKDLMTQMHDIISNLVVLTPNGPSAGLHPNSVASLQQFSTAFNSLLND